MKDKIPDILNKFQDELAVFAEGLEEEGLDVYADVMRGYIDEFKAIKQVIKQNLE